MNRYVLAAESDHVRAEWDRTRGLLKRQERGLQLAVEAFLAGTKPADLSGAPSADAPEHEWVGYWVGRGAVELEGV